MPLLELISSLGANPYFSAGFGLVGVGAGLAAARRGAIQWMSKHEKTRTQHVSVETSFVQYENGEVATKMQLVPSPGTHFIKVERAREKNVIDVSSGSLWETITLTTIGRSRKIFEDMLEEAKSLALQNEEGSTVIYTTMGGDWRRFGFPRKRRPLESVILDGNKGNCILNDARQFLSSSRWYLDRGIPYRRGYLLYGPPGTGKSSFITALAGELHLNICILNLHSKGINDDSLNHLLNIAPQRSIILLEDIDAALAAGTQHHYGLTLSGLLNALDGVAATEGGGRILFMTTNHIERLHPALIRPGRVDIKEFLDLASHSQMYRMFLRFYPGQEDLARKFSDSIPAHIASPAHLQAYFMGFKDNPIGAVENCYQLAENQAIHQNSGDVAFSGEMSQEKQLWKDG